MGEKFGYVRSAKLGILTGAGWGIIFTGCLANIRDVSSAFQVTVLIFVAILGTAITAPLWLHKVISPKTIDKVGGGDGNIPDNEEDDETDQ